MSWRCVSPSLDSRPSWAVSSEHTSRQHRRSLLPRRPVRLTEELEMQRLVRVAAMLVFVIAGPMVTQGSPDSDNRCGEDCARVRTRSFKLAPLAVPADASALVYSAVIDVAGWRRVSFLAKAITADAGGLAVTPEYGDDGVFAPFGGTSLGPSVPQLMTTEVPFSQARLRAQCIYNPCSGGEVEVWVFLSM